MNMGKVKSTAIMCSLCAGGVCGIAVGEEPASAIGLMQGRVVDVAHIYFNAATGEQVITLAGEGQTTPARSSNSVPIWSSMSDWCESVNPGHTTSSYFVVDDNSGSTALATGITALDYGDIAVDSLVDCVHINWITDHVDTDLDSNSIGDGVIGLMGEWSWFDADNARLINDSTRLPLVSIFLSNLPGDISGTNDPSDPDNTFARYSLDLDLSASLTSSMMFEIGDSDGDLQGAMYGNNDVDVDGDGIGDGFSIADSSIDPVTSMPFVDRDFDGLPDADLDGDGLFDWSWGVRFYQPGTGDNNRDGVIDGLDGDIADSMRPIGISLGSPAFTTTDNGDGTTSWNIDTSVSDAGFGNDDMYYLRDHGSYVGQFNFGGFVCTPAVHVPRADFAMRLYGPGSPDCCPSDLNCDGEVNFFDVSAFLQCFDAQGPECDLNNDGMHNFFDVSLFLNLYSAGCP